MSLFRPRTWSWLFVIYVIVGIVIAWQHNYITTYLLKLVLSALLAIFLWPLVLLGVGLHLH
jgi:predicted PurR-regulated permease PerM